MSTSIFWFRRDLRLSDNPALAAAAASGEVVPVFVIDPVLFDASGEPRREFLLDNLNVLNDDLHGRLVIRRGRPADVLTRLAAEVEATDVFCTEDFFPYGRRRDDRVESALRAVGATLHRVDSPFAVEPGTLRKSDGSPFKVFSPYRRTWEAHGWGKPIGPPDLRLAEVRSEGIPDRSPIDAEVLPAGEHEAMRRLELFLDERVNDYADERNFPGHDGTSRMSVFLKYGCIHPRQILDRLPPGKGAASYRSEICWRDFYADVLFHNPGSLRAGLISNIDQMVSDSGQLATDHFKAWCEGRTGFPMVDAGMRQLKAQAWMHNRVRMIVASFLVKDLHLYWTAGADYFMEKLQDGDLASNVHGWQWVAGVGTDPAPYFRIFNPVTQGQKFDPDGDYIKQFVPELRGLDKKYVHEPWLLPDGPPNGYPLPIVDHKEERAESLRRYAAAKD